MKKTTLWLLIARLRDPSLPYLIPSLAWMARDLGVTFETYFESERTGSLFAETGSTVIGGHHHQQFNYLCARFDVKVIKLGATQIFESSVKAFDLEVLAEAVRLEEIHTTLLARFPSLAPGGVFIGPAGPLVAGKYSIDLRSYLFPEILHRRALGFPEARRSDTTGRLRLFPGLPLHSAFLKARDPRLTGVSIDHLRKDDDWASLTARVARRWKKHARGVVFGDPAAVLCQMAAHCRHDRVAVYAPAVSPKPSETAVSRYVESVSPAAKLAADLAVSVGNRVIHGRQTGDGDIFTWAKQGVSIQIVDPNRPPFPVIETAIHPWTVPAPAQEATDEQLAAWAREGRTLTSLVVHSGEVAHNEAMIALIEMAGWSGLKFGLGAHAQRYETCPQFWELIAVAREHGGAAGLIEPLLHSGGLGVLAECNCPPALLAENCKTALDRISAIAGRAHAPKGYYAFMDSNLDRLDRVNPKIFEAIASAGIDHIVSSARPGRNRLLWEGKGCVAVNQSPRVIYSSSPFVRVADADDIETSYGASGPGWMIAAIDAPVVAFSPYIWREGFKIMELANELKGRNRVNVLPSTVARYARLLAREGILPRSELRSPVL